MIRSHAPKGTGRVVKKATKSSTGNEILQVYNTFVERAERRGISFDAANQDKCPRFNSSMKEMEKEREKARTEDIIHFLLLRRWPEKHRISFGTLDKCRRFNRSAKRKWRKGEGEKG